MFRVVLSANLMYYIQYFQFGLPVSTTDNTAVYLQQAVLRTDMDFAI